MATMSVTPALPDTIEIPAAVLVEACAELLQIEEMLLRVNRADTETSDALLRIVHKLIDGPTGISDDTETWAEGYRHPLMVEVYARGQEMIGEFRDAVGTAMLPVARPPPSAPRTTFACFGRTSMPRTPADPGRRGARRGG